MTNWTADATLEVDASCTFPVGFPFYFGPTAGATRGAIANSSQGITVTLIDNVDMQAVIAASESIIADLAATLLAAKKADTSLVATATPTASVGSIVTADASLNCTATLSAGTGYFWTADTSLSVTATEAVTGTRNAGVNASQPITADPISALLVNRAASASLAVSNSLAATAIRHQYVNASLVITDAITASLNAAFAANASQAEIVDTAAKMKLSGKISGSLPVMADPSAITGNSISMDASLNVSIFQPFPYVFPFSFETSANTLVFGRSIDTDMAVTADNTALATKGLQAHSNTQAITASFTAMLLQGFEQACDITLTAIATPTASVTRNQSLDVAQQIAVDPTGQVRWGAISQSALNITPETSAGVMFGGLIDVDLVSTTDTTTVLNMGALINSSFTAAVGTIDQAIRNQHSDINLAVSADTTAGVVQGHGVHANLAVQVTLESGTPEMTGFWPFYLR